MSFLGDLSPAAGLAASAGNLGQNQAAMAAQQNFAAQQAALAAQNQAALNNNFSNFGQQTDYYSGLGAAYGRATGGFNGPASSPNDPDGSPMGSVFETGAPQIPYLYSGSIWGANNGSGIGQGTGMAPGYGGFNNPAVPTSPQQWYDNGGYDPYNPNTYAPSAQRDLGTGFSGMGGAPLGAGSGGYDPGGFSSYPKGQQQSSVPFTWDNYFNMATAPGAGGQGGGWEAEYLLANPDVMAAAQASGQNVNAFADHHYQQYGQNEGRSVFDANAYLLENPDVFAAGANPFEHYNQYGKNEGRAAPMSSAFNPATYLQQNPDVAAAGVDPLAHYLKYGQNEGRSGGFFGARDIFDPATYLQQNPDVAAAGVDPFQHYMQYGQSEGRGSTFDRFNSDPGFDTGGYFLAHPDQYQAFLSANNQYTDPTAFVEMGNYQSPSNDYSTFQKGPSFDWQSSVPKGRDDPATLNAIYRAAGNTKLSPAAIAAMMNMESTWDPKSNMLGNYGLPQLSANMWGDYGGNFGGMDFNTFKNATGDRQIDAYADWLTKSNNLNKGGIDVASQTDPVMQAAILQAIQFGGNNMDWRTALANGNMNMPVTTSPQASDLKSTSINDMYSAYDRMMNPWRR